MTDTERTMSGPPRGSTSWPDEREQSGDWRGWITFAVGAGVGVMTGQTWARTVGIVFAAVSALVNLAFVAAYPFWSVIVIFVDVVVIYALAVHGRQMQT